MKTYSAKPSDIKRKWYVIDAQDLVLGRLASEAAMILRGKRNPYYTTNIDCGDNLVIINADKVKLTGNKLGNKTYYWHTGYPGGIKSTTAKQIVEGQAPEKLLRKAIQRMIPRSPMGRAQLRKLHIYAGTEHPHVAQKPETIDFAQRNRKNKI